MIKAKFLTRKYYDPEKGNSINTYCVEEGDEHCKKGDTITGLGYYLSNFKNIVYELDGEWVNNKTFGMQYQVKACREILSTSEEGVKAFLSCGMIKGIGPATAEKIYNAFKEDIFDIIENNPEVLTTVKGITKKKAEKIHASYMENKYAKELIGMLVPHGFTSKLAMKVYKIYGDEAVKTIQHNPYDLCKIKGFGFKTVDRMALVSHVSKTSPDRIKACIFYALKEHLTKGNLMIDVPALRLMCLEALSTPEITEQMVHKNLVELLTKKKLVHFKFQDIDGTAKEIIALPHVFQAETEVAQNIARLLCSECKVTYDVDKEIEEAQKTLGIKLDEIQALAIKTALIYNFVVVTGSPGTGKTTVINVFDYIYHKFNPNKNILYSAPTGRAARRISESTGKSAVTVHKAVGIRGSEENEDDDYDIQEITEDVIVVDEVSMLDVFIAKKLFEAIKVGKKILFVGDADQLPSVGPGLILYDIIKSKCVPVVELQKIFRQSEDSNIYVNIKKIKNGDSHLTYGNDFNFYPADTLDVCEEVAVKLYVEEVKKYGIMNVAFITPFRDRAGGVNSMNARLQEIFNPYEETKPEYKFRNTTFRVNDIVMELKNKEQVSNGDVGTVKSIVKDADGDVCITVQYFDSVMVEYTEEDLENLTLAYAMTVHKSQGSEYKSLITCLTMAHYISLKRNMPYTAFSRGKENVIFIGSKKALVIAISKKETEVRQTATAYKIRHYCNLYQKKAETEFKLNHVDNEYKQLSFSECMAFA